MSLLKENLTFPLIDAFTLPAIFSEAYRAQFFQQQLALKSLFEKSNDTGSSASDSAEKNTEQDERLREHDLKLENQQEQLTWIGGDYVSLSRTAKQDLSSPVGVKDSISVNGVQVIGPRVTGFIAASGAAWYGSFNSDLQFPVSVTYSQTEMQKLAGGVSEARKRLVAIERALLAHGIIGV